MEALKKALQSKRGLTAVVVMIAGMIVAAYGGDIFPMSNTMSDIVIFVGCIVSVAGTQELCQTIIYFRNGGE